jgi:DNA processing protein
LGNDLGDDRAYWLAWSQIAGIGPILLKRIQQQLGQLAIAWEASPTELRRVEGIGDKLIQGIIAQRPKIQVDALYAQYTDRNAQFITPADPEYPAALWETPDPPALLHYRGNLGLLEAARPIAIVGTRDITAYGRRWTDRLSAGLTQQGMTIVSGLAAGVDTVAHQSCLDAGGTTIAVLGTGVDLVYPVGNRGLYEQIIARGLLLSEYADGTPGDRRHFPARNRIVAGLCQDTIVTEAGLTSGALITARVAQEYGRQVHVLAGSLDNPQAAGCLKLIAAGAKIIASEEDFLGQFGAVTRSAHRLIQPARPQKTITAPKIPAHLEAIWATIGAHVGPIELDTIVTQTGLPTGDVLVQLLELELLSVVTQDEGMRYRVAS